MSQEPPPQTSAKSIPIADVTMDTSNKNVAMAQKFPVKYPDNEKNEFRVTVFASTLTKCRKKLSQIKEPSFPLSELLLGLSTAGIGAFLSALTTNIEFQTNKFQWIIFFSVLPALSLALLIAYFFIRSNTIQPPSRIAQEVLDELPDPDKTSEIETQR